EVQVRLHFDAAHYLRGYGGRCEALHGHRFEVVAGVRGERRDEVGLVYDFVELKQRLAEVLTPLDHSCLNDLSPFKKVNPSSENIAYFIYEALAPQLQCDGLSLAYIEVGESPESRVRYSP
ncbi:MAG: 6-carboxytetrahydropterin synthase QueD, partial [Chloroflexota bacterium]